MKLSSSTGSVLDDTVKIFPGFSTRMKQVRQRSGPKTQGLEAVISEFAVKNSPCVLVGFGRLWAGIGDEEKNEKWGIEWLNRLKNSSSNKVVDLVSAHFDPMGLQPDGQLARQLVFLYE